MNPVLNINASVNTLISLMQLSKYFVELVKILKVVIM